MMTVICVSLLQIRAHTETQADPRGDARAGPDVHVFAPGLVATYPTYRMSLYVASSDAV